MSVLEIPIRHSSLYNKLIFNRPGMRQVSIAVNYPLFAPNLCR